VFTKDGDGVQRDTKAKAIAPGGDITLYGLAHVAAPKVGEFDDDQRPGNSGAVPAIRGQLMGRFKLKKKNKNISKKNGGSKLTFA
jgi:hypothetical protein